DGGAPIAHYVGRSLDLIETLVSGGSAPVIVYQSRHDAMPVDLLRSVRRIQALRNALFNWQGLSLDRVIRVEMAWPVGPGERSWSTLAQELAFAVNHIVDAQKIIESRMRSYGCRVPEGFGSMELQPLRARSSVP